jgi:hypothetical protein
MSYQNLLNAPNLHVELNKLPASVIRKLLAPKGRARVYCDFSIEHNGDNDEEPADVSISLNITYPHFQQINNEAYHLIDFDWNKMIIGSPDCGFPDAVGSSFEHYYRVGIKYPEIKDSNGAPIIKQFAVADERHLGYYGLDLVPYYSNNGDTGPIWFQCTLWTDLDSIEEEVFGH